jgi:hypothetical protein
VVLDEAQGANLQMQLVAEILLQSGVLVVLLGDTNQHLSPRGTVNLFNACPVAHGADAFSLLLSFRFGAEGARAYNAALIPREPGQTVQPLMCGFGPPVKYRPLGQPVAVPGDTYVFTGRTNLGALEEALDSGLLTQRTRLFITQPIRSKLSLLEQWLRAADDGGDDGEDEDWDIWLAWFRSHSSERVLELVNAFRRAVVVVGMAHIPRGGEAAAVAITSTTSAIGNNLAGCKVVVCRDCLAPGMRAHAVVAITRAAKDTAGVIGETLFPEGVREALEAGMTV